MKKLFALILSLALVLSLTACNSGTAGNDPGPSPSPEVSDQEPSPPAASQAAPRIYKYEEERGDFTVTWTLTLIDGGMYNLDELHGLSGNVTSHGGSTWTDNGDGTITTGPWAQDENKSEFFEADGSCTWIVHDDGTMTPANAGDSGSEGGIEPGKYTYEEDRGDFKVVWEVMLMGNGSFSLSETHGLSGNVTEHAGSTWTDNGDGTATTGAWSDASSDKSEFFAPDGSCTWIIHDDGTCEPGEAGEGGGESAGGIEPGKYAYEEDRGDFKVTWEVLIMGNGQFRLDETHGLSGEVTQHTGSTWTDNGDGTFTTGAWDDASSDKSEFFESDGACTWTINADGTVTPVS